MKKLKTDMMIEEMINALGPDVSVRFQHVYRESLRGLVRLAKSEQRHDMRLDVERLSGAAAARLARRQAKAVLMAQQLSRASDIAQRKLEFDRS